MAKSTSENTGIVYAKIFFAIVVALIFIFGLFRLVTLYQERSFLHTSFNTIVVSADSVAVAGIDGTGNKSFIKIEDPSNELKSNSLAVQSVLLRIPLHASVYYSGEQPRVENFFETGSLFRVMTDMSIHTEGINPFDAVRMISIRDQGVIHGVSYNNITHVQDQLSLAHEALFRDSNIAANKTSLAIINATRVDGLGSAVGEMYSRTGFNVVAVESERGVDESVIYARTEGDLPTAEFIASTFGFPIRLDEGLYNVADVTIIFGEDMELSLEDL